MLLGFQTKYAYVSKAVNEGVPFRKVNRNRINNDTISFSISISKIFD